MDGNCVIRCVGRGCCYMSFCLSSLSALTVCRLRWERWKMGDGQEGVAWVCYEYWWKHRICSSED